MIIGLALGLILMLISGLWISKDWSGAAAGLVGMLLLAAMITLLWSSVRGKRVSKEDVSEGLKLKGIKPPGDIAEFPQVKELLGRGFRLPLDIHDGLTSWPIATTRP